MLLTDFCNIGTAEWISDSDNRWSNDIWSDLDVRCDIVWISDNILYPFCLVQSMFLGGLLIEELLELLVELRESERAELVL